MFTDWKDTSYDSILIIVGLDDEPAQISRCTRAAEITSDVVIQYHDLPDSATETWSSPSNSGSPGTTFELDCDYHLCVFYENIQ